MAEEDDKMRWQEKTAKCAFSFDLKRLGLAGLASFGAGGGAGVGDGGGKRG